MSDYFTSLLAKTLLAGILLLCPAVAAPYFKADESREIFQLEKIPLQIDSMKELARHLTNLARRPPNDSPAHQRSTAQMLALAMRLDPTSRDAREINRKLAKGELVDAPDDASLTISKSRLRHYLRWLATPDAGADANKLANYLTDAARTLSLETQDHPDIAKWSGIVPSLETYKKQENGNQQPADPKPGRAENPDATDPTDNGSSQSPPTTPKDQAKEFHIKGMTVSAPFQLETISRTRDPKNPINLITRKKLFQRIAKVKLALTPCKPDEKNRLTISRVASSDRHNNAVQKGVASTLVKLFTSRHSKLPNYKSTVTISGGHYSLSNGLTLATPLALMYEASLANTPLREDLHVCAEIDENGTLSQPESFWQMLSTLRKSKDGGLLIVSEASAKLMVQVLVYDEADFFTRWEVYSAKDLDQALAIAKKSSPAQITQAGQLFDSIQNLARKTDATKLAVNRSVRARLDQITNLAPNHLSAKILLIQGGGKRPMRLSEQALAHEIIPIITAMHKELMVEFEADRLKSTALKATHESARDKLDPIERLTDRSNNDIYQDAVKLANEFRRLSVIARRLKDKDSSHEEKKARSLFFDMQNSSQDLLARTRLVAGFPAPAKVETPE